ncbi:hypothetical protein F2P56_016937 [Juglans regia]|uniref:non-specific serine/threonine protein kinase n=1 Tax=Juglans regia TaxID=51240 RepID=A0A834CVN3_JUGRE|nr:hypothetical protein F2P56_016937 [Juglans regia]
MGYEVFGNRKNENGHNSLILLFSRSLSLSYNSLSHEIPPELGRLHRLQYLDLYNNSFGGRIPTNISSCSSLEVLYLGRNQLVGEIPVALNSLSKLRTFSVDYNILTGRIPTFLGNLSSLEALSATSNNLGGSIPDVLGQLMNLENFFIGGNRLSGTIPPSIFNLSSIREFDVGLNHQIQGSLPMDLGTTLSNLQSFSIGSNQFTGTIPPSISNASNMDRLQFQQNKLTGRVPSLENLRRLRILSIADNHLGSEGTDDLNFLCSLTNATSLEVLNININNFGGILPECIGNFSSTLKVLFMDNNNIIGKIPSGIGNLVNLYNLKMWNNQLSGNIPTSIGKLQRLEELSISGNNLSGNIPDSLGNLTMLSGLRLPDNNLQGSIPSSLGKCQFLSFLDLSENNLSGTIPPQVIGLSTLSIYLDLSENERLNIAIDVASALEYLHYNCETPIVHCDLKPSNVLLDDEMTGHVGDFGLARFSPETTYQNTSTNQSSSIGVRGTIGYTAPEYGTGNWVSTSGDVYSYGILLLEMFTKKKPTDNMFQGNLSLNGLVKAALPQRVVEIADPILFQETGEQTSDNARQISSTRRNKIKECLVLIFGIGVACSSEHPEERMNIRDAVTKLHLVRKSYLKLEHMEPTDLQIDP